LEVVILTDSKKKTKFCFAFLIRFSEIFFKNLKFIFLCKHDHPFSLIFQKYVNEKKNEKIPLRKVSEKEDKEDEKKTLDVGEKKSFTSKD
jgi:hypothetical protein